MSRQSAPSSASAGKPIALSPVTGKLPGKANAIEKRRTMIPILLTIGMILSIAGFDVLLSGPESALQDLLPAWAAVALLVVGSLAVAAAALNMWVVRQQISVASAHESATH